ncbi:PilN domain-containing protein [Atlantibacter sp.]|uniref:PilN domain-containing protein n=1 Tax=Atlantibacter sp. TaxID=1903473 RepID=UPI0028AE1D64|nr:PilN domain-containing protein [Atlantibacter sp.]
MSELINLLPWRAQRLKQRAIFWASLFLAGIITIAGACAAWRGYIEYHIKQARLAQPSPQQVEKLRDDNARQRQRLGQLAVIHQQRQEIIGHQAVFQRWERQLEQLAAQLPDAVWFTALRFDAGRLDITGKSLTAEALSQWAETLKALPGAGVLNQGATTRDSDANWQFHWSLTLEPDDAPIL